ncbi:MAG: radical SAM protein [Bdellovibrionaceae bacterium]|nr:radical SAM protein [Pseudobdellovibrionaceae bacterium]
MELIIKPTELCNFKCTFCSSTHLVDDKRTQLSHEHIFSFLKRFPNTSTIIVNGGDPLMMKPDYYWEIIRYLEERNMNTTLSFTTNLWAFYKNPEPWVELFKHPLVGINTSFNYGQTRRITKDRVYTEEDFWKVSDLFLEKIGYRPSFISVITEENFSTAIDNVYLAKKMNVECKLNYALASGDQGSSFLMGKIYEVYLQIIRLGLTEWEYNSKQIIRKKNAISTSCPLNRACDETIRCLQPESDYYSCGAFGDDKQYPISFQEEVIQGKKFLPLKDQAPLAYLKEDCLTCPLFEICNGCKKNISDIKKSNRVQEHCSAMQKNMIELDGLVNYGIH